MYQELLPYIAHFLMNVQVCDATPLNCSTAIWSKKRNPDRNPIPLIDTGHLLN